MAIEFAGSGSGEHVDLGAFDVPSGLSALTIMAWVIFDSFSTGDQRIISKATGQEIVDHWFMLSGNTSSQNRARLKTNGTTTTHYSDESSMSTGQLYHIGFKYTGSSIVFYRNGETDGTSGSISGTIDTSGSAEVRIGDNPGVTRKELDGTVEDIRIYDRALSDAEMQTIFASRSQDDINYGLLHRWNLNEGYSGQSASGFELNKDLSGSINGTPASNPVFRASSL